MIFFVTGGSASGKSEYAGRLAERLAEGRRILYIATLADKSAESAARIQRHRRLRAGGAYHVRECFSIADIERAAFDAASASYGAVLFDSLDGFTADVMFPAAPEENAARSRRPDAGNGAETEDPAGRTARTILRLADAAAHLIIVNDDIYSDGAAYDDDTARYMAYTARTAALLAARAGCVIRAVCGIPLLLKGENHEFLQIDRHNVFTVHTNPDAVH